MVTHVAEASLATAAQLTVGVVLLTLIAERAAMHCLELVVAAQRRLLQQAHLLRLGPRRSVMMEAVVVPRAIPASEAHSGIAVLNSAGGE